MIVIVMGRSSTWVYAERESVRVGEPVEFTVPHGLETPNFLRLEKFFQRGPQCGPNAVYILLKLAGISRDYSDVLRAIPLTDEGASLQDLKVATERFGLACEVRKDLSPDDVRNAPMPLILHLGGENVHLNGNRKWNHYTVVVGPSPNSNKAYIAVDTNNGIVVQHSAEALARNMSGYALVVTDIAHARLATSARPAWISLLVWAGVAAITVANLVMFLLRNRTASACSEELR